MSVFNTNHRHKYLLPTLLVFSSLALSSTSFADESETYTEEDFFIDIPTVVSATRQTQKLTETPVAITIIDQELIKASGALKITELFQLVPGVQSYNPSFNTPAVSYHGVSDNFPRRMEVMLNGHSVYLPLLSTVAWETLGITLNDVDYVEVIRGSNVPAFGSNAFLGAINIVTKHPLTHNNSTLETTQGAFNTEKYYASVNSNLGELEYFLSTNYETNDGNDFFDDGLSTRAVNLSGTLTPSLKDTIDFNLGVSDGHVNVGEADNLNNIFTRREHLTHYQHLRWNHVVDDKNELKLSFTHNYANLEVDQQPAAEVVAGLFDTSVANAQALIDMSFPTLNGTSQFGNSGHGKTNLYDLELQHTIEFSPQVHSVWGVGYRHETAESEILLSGLGEVSADKFRIFGNTQWNPINPLTINLGGMLEHSNLASARFSPRAAINYAINDTLSLRAAATRAYRTPSLLESNSTTIIYDNTGAVFDTITIPDPNLRPELLKSYELGLFKIWPDSGSTLDVRIFNEQISDAIDDSNISSTQSFDGNLDVTTNNSNWRNTGAEFQFVYKPSSRTNVLLSYGYNNVTGFRDRGLRGIDSLGAGGTRTGPRAPLHTASMLFNTAFDNQIDVSVGHYFSGEVNWLEGDFREAFTRTDLSLGKTFHLNHKTDLEVRLIIQNLFDRAYEDFYEFNEFNRRSFLQLKLDY